MDKFIKKSDKHIQRTFNGAKIIKCGYDMCMDNYYLGYYVIVENYGLIYRATTCYNTDTDTLNCEIESANF